MPGFQESEEFASASKGSSYSHEPLKKTRQRKKTWNSTNKLSAVGFSYLFIPGCPNPDNPISNSDTPQQCNENPVNIDQGLDFLKVWRGESERTRGNTMNKMQFLQISGSKFPISNFLISLLGCIRNLHEFSAPGDGFSGLNSES